MEWDCLQSDRSLAIAFVLIDMWISLLIQIQVIWSTCYALRKWTEQSNNKLEIFEPCVVLKFAILYNVFWLTCADLCLAFKMWTTLIQRTYKQKHLQLWGTITIVVTIIKILLSVPYIWYLLMETSYEWFLNIFSFFLLHLLFKFLFIHILHRMYAEIRRKRLLRKIWQAVPLPNPSAKSQ